MNYPMWECEKTTQTIIPIVAGVLSQLVSRSHKDSNNYYKLSKFTSSTVPLISLQDYLLRLVEHGPSSAACYVIALIYIDRVIQKHPHLSLNSHNIHRLLLTAVVVATKCHDDHFYSNAYYAKIGGVTGWELNALEGELLVLLDFELFVKPDLFLRYERSPLFIEYRRALEMYNDHNSGSGWKRFSFAPLSHTETLISVHAHTPRNIPTASSNETLTSHLSDESLFSYTELMPSPSTSPSRLMSVSFGSSDSPSSHSSYSTSTNSNSATPNGSNSSFVFTPTRNAVCHPRSMSYTFSGKRNAMGMSDSWLPFKEPMDVEIHRRAKRQNSNTPSDSMLDGDIE